MQKFSFFKTNRSLTPEGSLTLDQFIVGIKSGTWRKAIDALRKLDGERYKKAKAGLPGVTVSALLKSRDGDLTRKLVRHTGIIAIDIDKKDNPKLRTKDLIDKDCVAQFVSPSGKGLKILYYCKPTEDAAVHRRTYDAIIERLTKLGVTIKVDPVVKSIVSLQYVSFDEQAFYNPKSKLIIKALPPIKRKDVKAKPEALAELSEYVAALGKKDVTQGYEDWLNVMFGLSYSFGEAGRDAVHAICKNYPGYSKAECDEKYDACLESSQDSDAPITAATVFKLIADALPKAKANALHKKFLRTHAVGAGEEITTGAPELVGLVKFGLFLFKARKDKEGDVMDLEPYKLNLNEFEALLGMLGFFRFERLFVQVTDNVVDVVDVGAILYRVTRWIESRGDYNFKYKDQEYKFAVEDLLYRWRELRAGAGMVNQITASLPFWLPNILKDTPSESFVPYRNGVVVVTKDGIRLTPYRDMKAQIWRERILPREYKQSRTRGMFEDFFANVFGRGETAKARLRSPEFKRALWYYGYILHGTKRQSTARAWLLYDIEAGNNGRSGKTIIGSAVGHIRSVAVIDGKRTDLNDRFAFQNVKPWTNVIFIDDPDKRASLNPLFNMISGKTQTEAKGKDILEVDAKLMISSNYILELVGLSEKGRQFVSQASDFYSKYARAKETIQPVVDLHGKEFFTDWDAVDWNQFDSFSLRAIQSHLRDAAPSDTIVGNAAQLRFIQTYEEELFFALAQVLANHSINFGEGSAIVQSLLTDAVKEYAPDLRKPGIAAKDFLRSVGAIDLRNSTTSVGGNARNVWAFGNRVETLNFGKFTLKALRGKSP